MGLQKSQEAAFVLFYIPYINAAELRRLFNKAFMPVLVIILAAHARALVTKDRASISFMGGIYNDHCFG